MGYQLIETISVGAGGAASIEFTGIPQDGVDLQILLSGQVLTGGLNIDTTFNNNTSSVYSWKGLRGNGSSTSSAQTSSQSRFISIQATGSPSGWGTFSNASIYIPNYAGTSQKSVLFDAVNEQNSSQAFQELYSGLFANTSPITSIKLSGEGGNNLAQYSSASLYKITAD